MNPLFTDHETPPPMTDANGNRTDAYRQWEWRDAERRLAEQNANDPAVRAMAGAVSKSLAAELEQAEKARATAGAEFEAEERAAVAMGDATNGIGGMVNDSRPSYIEARSKVEASQRRVATLRARVDAERMAAYARAGRR